MEMPFNYVEILFDFIKTPFRDKLLEKYNHFKDFIVFLFDNFYNELVVMKNKINENLQTESDFNYYAFNIFSTKLLDVF